MRKFILAAALSATALTGVAVAAQSVAPGDRAAARLAKIDTNKDGAIQKSEALAMADQHFARLDTNGDGKLTVEELAAGKRHGFGRHGHGPMRGGPDGPPPPGADGAAPPPPPPGQPGDRAGFRAGMLKKFDTNGDGKLDDTERAAARAEFEKKLDTNGDGKVDDAERAAARAKWQGRHPGGPGGRGWHRGPGGPGEHGFVARFAKLDTDKDGLISKAEFDAQAMERFARADTNNDGKIDAAEQKAAFAKMRDHFGKRPGMMRGDGPPPAGDMPPPPPEDAPDAPSGQ